MRDSNCGKFTRKINKISYLKLIHTRSKGYFDIDFSLTIYQAVMCNLTQTIQYNGVSLSGRTCFFFFTRTSRHQHPVLVIGPRPCPKKTRPLYIKLRRIFGTFRFFYVSACFQCIFGLKTKTNSILNIRICFFMNNFIYFCYKKEAKNLPKITGL